MADELSAPLVRRKDRAKKKREARLAGQSGPRLPIARLAAGAILLIAVGVGIRVILVNDPNGGRPIAEVAVSSTRDTNPIAGQVAPPPSPVPPAAVVAPTGAAVPIANGPSFTTLDDLPDSPDVAAIGTADSTSGIVSDLAEVTDDGPIPRKASDGTTAFSTYAAPAPETDGKPMIAIVVTGLGLNEASTLDAVGKLPAPVTLAFAPYGKTLDRTVGAARSAGHELLLEIPLEPFDYPDNDPGPQTLLAGQPPRANLDKLFWLMARFGGYIGVINNMGARFTSSGADFGPVMEELGSRGLGYLDDGSSNRSLAAQLATGNNVPFSRADVDIDSIPAPEEINAALLALESRAKKSGSAIGVVSALPISIDTVAQWAKTLADRGFALVPVSALMKGKSDG